MIFSGLKGKQRKAYRQKNYDDILLNFVTSMFTYKGFPDTVQINFIDIYRVLEGASAIWECDGEWIVSHVNLGGKPYPDGIGSTAICATDNGHVEQFEDWRRNSKVAIIFNNGIYTPDLNIGVVSDLLTEIDISLEKNVLYSRLLPIPVVYDGKMQRAIESALDDILKEGKTKVILSEDVLARIKNDLGSNIDMVNLTDVKNSQYIQYLAKFRDDVFRWFYSQYGMNSQGSSKLAQQTVDEVNQDTNASMVIPHDMLRAGQEGIDMCNNKFGWNAEISFSECWMSRLADFSEEFKENIEENIEEKDEEKVEEKDEEKVEEKEEEKNEDMEEEKNEDK